MKQLLADANTHGEQFYCTGGQHACTDDVFKAMEMNARKQKIAVLEEDKMDCIWYEQIEGQALETLQKTEGTPVKKLQVPHLKMLLMFYGFVGKQLNRMKKTDLIKKYKELKSSNAEPRKYKKWTADEEFELEKLKKPIGIEDTALGRYRTRNKEDQLKDVLNQLTEWGVNDSVLEAVEVGATTTPLEAELSPQLSEL